MSTSTFMTDPRSPRRPRAAGPPDGPASTTGRASPSSTTNRSWEPRAFLSTRIAASRSSKDAPEYDVGRPTRPKTRRCRSTRPPVRAAGEPGQLGDVHAADRDGLAVPDRVALGALDRVGQGVAVVEHLAAGVPVGAAGLLEVADDHVDLDLDGPLDQLAAAPATPGVSGRDSGPPRPAEDLGVGDEAALHHLAEPGDELGPRKRVEQGQVAQHAGGLVERADQVLARRRC